MEKFVLLVVFLNSKLHYNFFCNHILFINIARQYHYKTKKISKLVLLSFLFDLFSYLLNFFAMFDRYRMVLNYTLRFVLLILFMIYFISAQECTRSQPFKDRGYSLTFSESVGISNTRNFFVQSKVSHFIYLN